MNSFGKLRGLWISILLLASFSTVLEAVRAEYRDLDQFCAGLSKDLDTNGIQRLAVAPFAASGGASFEHGRYFSELLANSLRHHAKRLKIPDSAEFEKELRDTHLDPQNVSSQTLAGKFTTRLREDALIVGSVMRDDHNYELQLSVFRLLDSKTLFSQSTKFLRTGFMDSLTAPFPPDLGSPIFKPGTDHVSLPSCSNPGRSAHKDHAMVYHRHATVTFDVLISSEGRVVAQRPAHLVGDELDEITFDQNSLLTCKPAKDQKGRPVNVIFPLDTSFALTD